MFYISVSDFVWSYEIKVCNFKVIKDDLPILNYHYLINIFSKVYVYLEIKSV